jgi:hypothetical protein
MKHLVFLQRCLKIITVCSHCCVCTVLLSGSTPTQSTVVREIRQAAVAFILKLCLDIVLPVLKREHMQMCFREGPRKKA